MREESQTGSSLDISSCSINSFYNNKPEREYGMWPQKTEIPVDVDTNKSPHRQ